MRKIVLIALIIITISCSNDEIIIDNSVVDVAFVMQRKENSLEILNFKDNSITQIDLPVQIGKIDLIKRFRGKYYLLNKAQRKIFVLENIASSVVNEIDLSVNDFIITDFCFPNATDCYIIYEDAAKVGIIDLMANKLTNIEIELSGIASDIAGTGNQVYATLPNNNLVAVIDTRTNEVYSEINISDKPILVDFTTNGNNAIVVCIGNDATIPSKINIIDLATKNITKTTILAGKDNIALDIIPNAMAVSDRFIYISADNKANISAGGYRISTSNYSASTAMIKNKCIDVIMNYNCSLFIENAEGNINCVLFNNNDKATEINIGSINCICEK